MVEIEEVPPDQPHNDSPPWVEKDLDGWEKLMGDDLLLKVIEKSKPAVENGPQAINPQDAVLVDFVGRVAGDKSVVDGPIFQEAKSWLVLIGEGDVLPCLEMAIRFMETGQTGRVWSHSKYAFGPGTRSYTKNGEQKQLPSNASVMFEIKVIMVVMDTSRLNPYFTIQKASTRKSIANDIYQHEWCPKPKSPSDPSCEMAMSRAIRLYTKAAKDMESLLQGTYFQQVEADHPQRGQTRQLLMDCLNNIVAVHLRQHQYHTAKQASIEVLKQDPKNIKALLRAAKSALLDPASTLEEVQAALKAAEAEITYKNPAEEKELKQIKARFKRKQQEYKEQSKAMFGNKLQKGNGLFPGDDPKEKSETNESSSSTSSSSSAADKEAANSSSDRKERDAVKDISKPRVSFDEATTKPPNSKGTEADMMSQTADKDDKADDSTFWKQQGMSLLIQVIIPLVVCVIIRRLIQTYRMGEETLVMMNQARMPEVNDPDIVDFD